MSLNNKRVVVGIGGGIAAFKAVQLVRELGRRGAEVRVMMTDAAARFVGPVTFAGLTGRPAVTDLWAPDYAGEVHVELGEWADVVVIAPATMNLIARAANGHANDVVLATLACARGQVILAPAMHHRMWAQASTQRNVAALTASGIGLAGPVEGPLASGETGMGRMAEPDAIADSIERALGGGADLEGRHVVVSAGPTYEDLDPVRYLGNRSTGRMGYAIAAAALQRGARVTLVSGPTNLVDPAGVTTRRVRTAREMDAAVHEAAADADLVVMAAAVADYRPEHCADDKVKKAGDLTLRLVRNPDILAGLGEARRSGELEAVLVGFALETTDLEANARGKLQRKRVDLIVANEAKDGFGGDTNRAALVTAEGVDWLATMSKRELAERILDAVVPRFGESGESS